MARDFAAAFYRSSVWQNARNAYAARRHYLCERCLAKGILRPGEIVHHKIYLTPDNINDPRVTLNEDNFELVCRNCHAEIHAGKRFTIDKLGRIIPR